MRDIISKPIEPAVYILSSKLNGTLYVGVTPAIFDRMMQHRTGTFPGFTKRHGVTRLVYFEFHTSMAEATRRERQLKKWNRLWKIRLIEQLNPGWCDLFDPAIGARTEAPGQQSHSR